MYSLQLPDGQFLEEVPQLQFELNNQVFSTSKTDVLPGSFSFPTDLNLSDRNRLLLDNPQLINNARKWKKIENVTVYCYGVPLFVGTLKISETSAGKAKIYVVTEAVGKIKDSLLANMQTDYLRDFGDNALACFTHMELTSYQPEDFDYAFFPVYIPTFDDTPLATPLAANFQNHFDGYTQDFNPDSAAFTPFIRVDFLLKRIFQDNVPDYTFVNGWQIDRELGRLYLWNNYDVRESSDGDTPDFPEQIDLRKHLGELKGADLLKWLMSLFCLGLFTDVFGRKITLIALRDILRRPPAHDWSQYVLADYVITDDSSETPLKFCHPQPEGSPPNIPDDVPLPSYSSDQEFQSALGGGLPDGLYYIEAEELVMQVFNVDGSSFATELGIKRKCVVFGDSPEFEPGIGVPFTWHFASQGHYPWIMNQTGSYFHEEGDPLEWKRVENKFDPFLMFYRGFQENTGEVIHDRPYASNDVWNAPAQPLPARAQITTKSGSVITSHGDAQYSLLWYSDRGLYAQWWAAWHQMLMNGKHVTRQFALPVARLIEFSFQDKIRIHNLDYFVKKLKVGKAIGNGLLVVEASLVSVI